MEIKKCKVPLWLRLLAKLVKNRKNPDLPCMPELGQWYWVKVPDCMASDGSEYGFDIRVGSENKLIIFLHGGGVSFNGYMAARPFSFNTDDLLDCYYSPQAGSYGVNGRGFGLLSNHKDNQFRDWSAISLPYCTADFHCGTGDFSFTARDGLQQVLHHHGYKNYRAALESALHYIDANPERIIVSGNSAGGFGAALLTDDIIEHFANCKDVTCHNDSGMMRMDGWHEIAAQVWKAPTSICDRLQTNDITLDSLLALKEKHRDRVKILFSCSIRDVNLAQLEGYKKYHRLYADRLAGEHFEKDLEQMVSTLINNVPDVGLFLFDTPAAGIDGKNGLTKHCIVIDTNANTTRVQGKTALEWLWNGVNGQPEKLGLNLLEGQQ